MPGRTTTKPKLVDVRENAARSAAQSQSRRGIQNQVDLAHDRIEELIVNCKLRPGRFLAMQDLQDQVGLGRTPVHQAIGRLAADTLLIVRPRHGIQIAPIDLARERVLLQLRRDMERFVIRLASERSGPSERNHMLHLRRLLLDHRQHMTLAQFNVIDRRVNRLLMAAAAEPFVEHALRPLQTIFRRIGWLYHSHAGAPDLHETIDAHVRVLDAVANRHLEQAISASDELIDFVDRMFDVLEREIDPGLLDVSLGYLNA
jgi:DNA-binding GntR family transcriptional regulator